MAEALTNDRLVRDYIDFMGADFIRRRHHYVLLKALEVFVQCCNANSVEEALEFAKNNNGSSLAKALQSFVNYFQAKDLKPKTVLFYLNTLCRFLRFYDVPYESALKKIKKPRKVAVRVDRIPTIDELQKIILKSKSPRLGVYLQLLAQTGLRRSEAARLRLKHLDLENGWIHLTGDITKNGRPRDVPIISELRETLKNYINREKIKDYLFPSFADFNRPMQPNNLYDAYYDLLKRLGLAEKDDVGWKLHFHVLRKWFKTQLEHAGVNRLLIMSWMGHDAGTQAVYYLPTQEQIKAEIEKAERALRIFGIIPPSPEVEEKIREVEEKTSEKIKEMERTMEELKFIATTFMQAYNELAKERKIPDKLRKIVTPSKTKRRFELADKYSKI